jgi:hypothetical protein
LYYCEVSEKIGLGGGLNNHGEFTTPVYAKIFDIPSLHINDAKTLIALHRANII